MPRREIHDLLEHALLGKITGMNELMDLPSRTLSANHRIVFHDPLSVLILAGLIGGDYADNVAAGLLHLMLDFSLSETKRAIRRSKKLDPRLKKFLKFMADMV